PFVLELWRWLRESYRKSTRRRADVALDEVFLDHERALEPEVPRDDHPLDFVRALADLEDLLVAVEPRDRVLLHVAVAAVDLERPVRDAVRQLARVELRHRGFLRERAALVLEPRRLVDEIAPRLDLRGHVRESELDGLELDDRLAELASLLRVALGEVVRALREADGHRRDRGAAD